MAEIKNEQEKIDRHSLYGQWRGIMYDMNADKGRLKVLWDEYFETEKNIYAQLLAEPDVKVTGTVAALAEKYGIDPVTMTGFLDGINESLVTPNDYEKVTEDSEVSLAFDTEKLYKNMVKADAEWLYELPQWDAIYDAETRKAMYLEQKRSRTVVKGKKIGRNDPCPCGSGKKYKQCCGKL